MIKVDEISAVDSPTNGDEMRAKYDENGYVVVRNVLDPSEDLQPVINEYNQLLSALGTAMGGRGQTLIRLCRPPV